MKKTILNVMMLFAFSICFSSFTQAQLLWDADTDGSNFRNNFEQWQLGVAISACTGNSGSVANVFESGLGRNVGRIIKSLGTGRAELSRTNSFTHRNNQFVYYSWKWAISVDAPSRSNQSDFTGTNDELTVFQWKTERSGTIQNSSGSQNYPLNMEYRNGILTLNYWPPCRNSSNQIVNWSNTCTNFGARRQILASISVPQNQWVDIVLGIRKGTEETGSNNGRVRLWINASEVGLRNPATGSFVTGGISVRTNDAYNNAINDRSVYPKWGVYNAKSCNYRVTTYYDKLKAYSTSTAAINNLSGGSTSSNNNTSSNWTEISPGKSLYASSVWPHNPGYDAWKANDGDASRGSRWASSTTDSYPAMWYDLGGVKNVRRIKVKFDTARSKKLRVYTASGGFWTSLGDYNVTSNFFQLDFNRNTDWIMVQSLSSDYNHISIQEFDVFGYNNTGKNASEKTSSQEPLFSDNDLISDLQEKSVSVFPNPVSDVFSINLKGFKSANVEIADLLGKVVYKISTEEDTVQLSKGTTFTSGLYIIKVTDSQNKTFTNKLVVK